MKQQGHFFDVNKIAYSPDGSLLATGSEDGKVKVWRNSNCYCLNTFKEHTAQITDIQFMSKKGNAIITASKDGSVRAFDLVKGKNFRTFSSPTPVQFMSATVDHMGIIVCGGSFDPYDIYIWSMKTGDLVEVLKGHSGPVSCLRFSPTFDPILISGSWDQTVKVWNMFTKENKPETLTMNSEITSLDI